MSPVSERVFADACRWMPGGVAAAARLHRSLGRPFLTDSGAGSRVRDVDGREYLDLETSFGASLLGHAHPAVVAAIQRGVADGIVCGHDGPHQTELARRLVELIPSAEMVRFTGSGTETTWHAVRICRAVTGRDLVVKFEGHFHGFNDVLGYNFWPATGEAAAGGQATPRPESAGIPLADRDLVRVLPWNDLSALERLLEVEGHQVAAVVMEPVNIDSGVIHPQPGYLAGVRDLTTRHGALLVFDEILSGFRTNLGGAQAESGVTPDLTTIGKAIGGGLPLSAVVGRRDLMEVIAPLGPVVHSGTFVAHLLPILAGIAFLDVASDPAFYPDLLARSGRFVAGLRGVLADAGLRVRVQQYGPRFGLLFGLDREPRRYGDVAGVDHETELRFYREAIGAGVYLHHGWHHGISAAHTDADLDEALERLDRAARRTAPAAHGDA